MIFELGSVRIATGRHASTPPPTASLSPDTLKQLVEETLRSSVEKIHLPPGAVPARDLSEVAAQLTTAAPASGIPPNPGPVPLSRPTLEQPLRWQYPIGYNAIPQPGRGKVAPFTILRQLAKVSDIIRICIETRKDQITSLAWDVAPKDKTQRESPALKKQADAARAFFRSPDKRRSFQRWVRQAIEDILVVDALSIYRQPTRGGGLHSLRIIDGTTIVPLIDAQGEIPLPPHVAYRQIIYGQPVQGGDCTTEQLYYLPRTVTESPYGLSPTEAVLLAINASLNRATFNLAYYSEGNVPRGLAEAPANWTPEQIKDFQRYFDELLSGTGNFAARSRIKMVGSGMAEHLRMLADPDFSTEWDLWLLKIACASFAVPPSEIGFTDDVNKATSDKQENIVYRRGVKPLTLFLKELFDTELARSFTPELEFQFIGGEPEDKESQARVDAIYLARGVESVDDIRVRQGKTPIGIGPTIDTPLGPMPVDQLLEQPPDDDTDTSEIGDPTDATADELEAEAQKDLRTWKNFAIKSLKTGRPQKRWVSEAIPADVKTTIHIGLLKAKAPADVIAVFERFMGQSVWPAETIAKAAGEYRAFVGAPRVALTRFNRHFAKQFKAQGRDLGAYLEAVIAKGDA